MHQLQILFVTSGEDEFDPGRQRFGNISIAATDAATNAMTESAIGKAHRAIINLG